VTTVLAVVDVVVDVDSVVDALEDVVVEVVVVVSTVDVVDELVMVDVVVDEVVVDEVVLDVVEDVELLVVVGLTREHAHSALHAPPPAHGPPSQSSPLAASTTPSPHRLAWATNDSFSFDFFAMRVPWRFVHVVSTFAFSLTFPFSPSHDGQTAKTLVPWLVAFSFAWTGAHAFPMEISGPTTIGSIGTAESPVTSALPVTRYRPPGQGRGFGLWERPGPAWPRTRATEDRTIIAPRRIHISLTRRARARPRALGRDATW
jgi:hypothetical protein